MYDCAAGFHLNKNPVLSSTVTLPVDLPENDNGKRILSVTSNIVSMM
jgi:hypothetical protein